MMLFYYSRLDGPIEPACNRVLSVEVFWLIYDPVWSMSIFSFVAQTESLSNLNNLNKHVCIHAAQRQLTQNGYLNYALIVYVR